MTHILRLDASARSSASVSRKLADAVITGLPDAKVTSRDLRSPLPIVTEDWINAAFTPADQRSAEQAQVLATSDALVAELSAADVIVIATPIYNFGVPANLKAWIDQVARAGVTFQYTANGPVGLLHGKRAVLAVASGGTQVGSEIDFATSYLRHALGFLGIKEVEVVTAESLATAA